MDGSLQTEDNDFYGANGDEQWSTSDAYENGALSTVDYETYNSDDSPISSDVYDTSENGFSLGSSEDWQYDASDILMNYYKDVYNYVGTSLSSSDESYYSGDGSPLGYNNDTYDAYGYVNEDNLGFYDTSGYLGYASTAYGYNGEDVDLNNYETTFYNANSSPYGSFSDTYGYDDGYVDNGELDYSGYSDSYLDGEGSLDYNDGYLIAMMSMGQTIRTQAISMLMNIPIIRAITTTRATMATMITATMEMTATMSMISR